MSRPKIAKVQDTSERPFQPSWTELYGFVPSSGKALCVLCNDVVVNRTSSVKRHFSTLHLAHIPTNEAEKLEYIKSAVAKFSRQKSVLHAFVSKDNKRTEASYEVASVIARHGKPFTDGEYIKDALLRVSETLFSDLKNKDEIVRRVKEVPLSDSTIRSRIMDMADDVESKQSKDLCDSPFFSIACDESTDVRDVAQLAIMARYFQGDIVIEDLIGIFPMYGTCRGVDIVEVVRSQLKERNVDLNRIVSVATDGAPSMTGKRSGFCALLLEEVRHPVLPVHCIIHMGALCASVSAKALNDVMSVVVRIVNFIVARALSHRQFRALLSEVNSEYGDLLLHCDVRWLSRGAVLERFVSCLNEIKTFLNSKGQEYAELSDSLWLCKLGFLTDISSHLNVLNKKLQGRGLLISSLLEEVRIFERRIGLFIRDLKNQDLKHFSTLRSVFENQEDREKVWDAAGPTLLGYLHQLQSSFESRFNHLGTYQRAFRFITHPLETSGVLTQFSWIGMETFEEELIMLQEQETWSEKFKQLQVSLEELERRRADLCLRKQWKAVEDLPKPETLVCETWASLPSSFSTLKRAAMAITTIFGSTYTCEKTFSDMNFIHSKLRNRLTDEATSACLRLKTTCYNSDIERLAAAKQSHPSH